MSPTIERKSEMTLVTPYVIAIQAVFAQPLKIYLEHFYIKETRRWPILAMTRVSGHVLVRQPEIDTMSSN